MFLSFFLNQKYLRFPTSMKLVNLRTGPDLAFVYLCFISDVLLLNYRFKKIKKDIR